MKKLKNWIVSSAKNLWGLNWEAKIGILLLIAPIVCAFIFIFELFDSGFDFRDFYYGWDEDITPVLLYWGLMAIAGAYLIKGNLKKKE